MRTLLGLLLGLLLVAACQSGPPVVPASPGPGQTARQSASPEPSVTDAASAFHPLPPDLLRVPGPRDPSASLTASSAADAQAGVIRPFQLQHCGLGSPFDFDGSLWDPVAGRDATGGPIDSDEEIGELINPTEGEVVLLGSGQAEFRTPGGSVVLLTRHVGARTYFLCA